MAQEQKFVVGDWVTIIEDGWGCGPEDVGRTVPLVDPRTVTLRWPGSFPSRKFAIQSVQGDFVNIDEEAYRKATDEEILKSGGKMQKKIRKYVFKKEYVSYTKAAEAIIGCMYIDFVPNSRNYEEFVKAGVLDLWFEPVYEEEGLVIAIGDPLKMVKILRGKAVVDKYEFPREHIIDLAAMLNEERMINVFRVTPLEVWFGCIGEGTKLTKNDVNKLLEAYKKINP